MSDEMSFLQAALDEAQSPSWSQRARAGRELAVFADIPAAADALFGLLLDVDDTAVTRQTSEALARVGTSGAMRLIAHAVSRAEESHHDWMEIGVHDALGGPDGVAGIAAVCGQLARDPEATVRWGAAVILAWTDDST
ncbi:hypothetical protein [Streptomyces sp. NPDC056796]|uniref:hypothetical protein n=1 Tax=Streptomyces sp. NPDC056796 TaxID=3345947 RepID=UPI0036989B43